LLCILFTVFIIKQQASAELRRSLEEEMTQESVYTIQISSFKDKLRAEHHFRVIEQSLNIRSHMNLRVEKIGMLHAVRIGKFISLTEAEQFLKENKLTLAGAIVMKAYFIPERVIMIQDGMKINNTEEQVRLSENKNILNVKQVASNLGIMLIGTVLADNPERSMVIIESLASGDQEVYKEGEMLKDILIKRILNRRIIIDNGKGNTVLTMEGDTNTGSQPSESFRVRLQHSVVNEAVPTYSHMMRMIRLRPYYRKEGLLEGFIIYNIKPESIFERMGFENGDLIIAITGKPIVDTQQAVFFYEVLQNHGMSCIGIKRNNNNRELCIELS
jgi:type II secretion system protein C